METLAGRRMSTYNPIHIISLRKSPKRELEISFESIAN